MDDGAVSVASKNSDKRRSRSRDSVQTAALQALSHVLEPLAGFVLDMGLSVQEAQALLRSAAVHSVAKRQRETQPRVSISGIAASTGIPRAEISRILRAPARAPVVSSERRQQATTRILAAWQDDPKFAKANGQPATLKVYGEGPSFDALVKAYGRGLPTRAMLDELVRTQAVALVSAQKVRIKAPSKAQGGVNAQSVKVFGERAEQVLATMLEILREPQSHQFVASVEGPLELGRSSATRTSQIYISCKDLISSVRVAASTDAHTLPVKATCADVMRASVIVCYKENKFVRKRERPAGRIRRNLCRADQ